MGCSSSSADSAPQDLPLPISSSKHEHESEAVSECRSEAVRMSDSKEEIADTSGSVSGNNDECSDECTSDSVSDNDAGATHSHDDDDDSDSDSGSHITAVNNNGVANQYIFEYERLHADQGWGSSCPGHLLPSDKGKYSNRAATLHSRESVRDVVDPAVRNWEIVSNEVSE
jgi:hypothetical protein